MQKNIKRRVIGQKGIAAFDIIIIDNDGNERIQIPKGALIQVDGFNEKDYTILYKDLNTRFSAYSTYDAMIPD